QGAFGGTCDAFCLKFDATGNRLWATYYGGDQGDFSYGIATDNIGNIVITGYTQGGTFPANNAGGTNVTWQGVYGGGTDAFIVKFDAAGNRLWATYYGGNAGDYSYNIAVNNLGDIVITGLTSGGSFPANNAGGSNVTWQGVFGGGIFDAFVVKFDATGNRLWATYYGGDQWDQGNGITTDKLGNVTITGYTRGGTFPASNAGGVNVTWQGVYGGGTDAFVAKFDAAGNRLWATFYGANQWELGYKVVTDVNNNIYLLMEAEDVATPLLADACSWQPVFNGGSGTNIPGNHTDIEDQTIVKFNPNGKKLCATYLGGTGEDDLDTGSGGIAVYGTSLYISGNTDGGFPVTAGTAQTIFGGGGWDAYVATLCTNICEGKTLGLDFTSNTTNACANAAVKFTPSITNSCDTTGYKFHWIFTGGNPAASDSAKPTVTFPGVGTHDVKLIVTTICKKDSLTTPAYITVVPCGCSLSANATMTTNATCNGVMDGSASVNISNGSGGPYTYNWSNETSGITTGTTIPVTGLSAASYTVTITEGACISTSTVTITAPTPLIGQFTKGTANCTGCGCKEWVMINATGSTNPYSYSWPDGYTNRYKNHLCSGTFTINIKDKNGCSVTVNVTTP
ncbi:MAG: hypothetical protein HYU69_15550, partial [Bacteroidetes bacterium]|nr:hypothetical protein [Bacteroidota bacterium]